MSLQKEIKIKGTPTEFGLMAGYFGLKLDIKFGSPQGPRFYPDNPNEFVNKPDAPRVIIWMEDPENDKRKARIVAIKIPDGTLLQVVAHNKDWPFLINQWEMLWDEMERLGFVDAEPKMGSGHYKHPDPLERKEIVNHYRQEREKGRIINPDAWAKDHHGISGKTLKRYEDEFPADT